MIADVDFFVEKPNGKRGILECKTSSFMNKDKWADDAIPRHYEMQGKHYMSVTNLDFCAFACLFGNSESDFVMREIERDLDEEEMTIMELARFWRDFVMANVEPPYTENGELVLESIRRYQGKADPSLPEITLSPADVARLEQYLTLKEERPNWIDAAGRWKRISKPSMPPSSIRWARAALRSAYPARPSIRSAISLPPRPV